MKARSRSCVSVLAKAPMAIVMHGLVSGLFIVVVINFRLDGGVHIE